MPSDDGSPLAREAVSRLDAAGLGPHIGYVQTVQRDGSDLPLIDVRRELRRSLTPTIVAALEGLTFRLRGAGIPDSTFYGSIEADDEHDFPGVIVEPPGDDRPELVQRMYRQLEAADLHNVVGSVGLEGIGSDLRLSVGVSARVPHDREPAIREALAGLPVGRLYWRQPRHSAS